MIYGNSRAAPNPTPERLWGRALGAHPAPPPGTPPARLGSARLTCMAAVRSPSRCSSARPSAAQLSPAQLSSAQPSSSQPSPAQPSSSQSSTPKSRQAVAEGLSAQQPPLPILVQGIRPDVGQGHPISTAISVTGSLPGGAKTASRAGQGSRQRRASQAVPLHGCPAEATARPQ